MGERAATLTLVGLLGRQVDLGVPRRHHAIIQAEAPPARVIEERLLLGVSQYAEARCEDGL